MLPCPEKAKLRVSSGRSGVILSLLVRGSLEIWLLVQQLSIQKNRAATFTPTGAPCSSGHNSCDARNSYLTLICLDAQAKVQIQA